MIVAASFGASTVEVARSGFPSVESVTVSPELVPLINNTKPTQIASLFT